MGNIISPAVNVLFFLKYFLSYIKQRKGIIKVFIVMEKKVLFLLVWLELKRFFNVNIISFKKK